MDILNDKKVESHTRWYVKEKGNLRKKLNLF